MESGAGALVLIRGGAENAERDCGRAARLVVLTVRLTSLLSEVMSATALLVLIRSRSDQSTGGGGGGGGGGGTTSEGGGGALTAQLAVTNAVAVTRTRTIHTAAKDGKKDCSRFGIITSSPRETLNDTQLKHCLD